LYARDRWCVEASKLNTYAYPAIRHSRGYVDFGRLFRLHTAGAFFVIRLKAETSYYVEASHPVVKADSEGGVQSNQTIILKSVTGKRNYPAALRRISFVDPETRKFLVFLTNNFELSPLTIALIYRRRWKVELFFRWIKQHLRLRGFFSTSPNGVRVLVWGKLKETQTIKNKRYTTEEKIHGKRPRHKSMTVVSSAYTVWSGSSASGSVA
jgi:hypothetical protein